MPGIKPGMRYLITIFLFVLQAVSGRAQTPTDVHGTWTAELHSGKVFLQVRITPPPDWNRSGNWNGDWNMGQSFPVDDLSGLPAKNDQLTAASVKFDLRREAGTLAFEGSFRDGRGEPASPAPASRIWCARAIAASSLTTCRTSAASA